MFTLNTSAQIVIEGHYEGLSALVMIGVAILIFFLFVGLLISPALIVAAIARRRVEKVLNHRQNTVITQYDPPRGLLPAEMSLLYDMKIEQSDLVATLFDLEQRGVISIKNSSSVEILDQSLYESLPEFEKIAVRTANGNSNIPESQPISLTLEPGRTVTLNLPPKKGLLAFEYAVRHNLQQKGINMGNYSAAFALRVIIVAFLVSLLPLFIIAIPGSSNGIEYDAWSTEAFITALRLAVQAGIFLFPAYIIFSIILIKFWTKIAGHYWLNSKQARVVWPELEGYRRFLEQVDIDNIQFESTTRDEQEPVTKTLPYALAFGLTTKWQERLRTRQKNEHE